MKVEKMIPICVHSDNMGSLQGFIQSRLDGYPNYDLVINHSPSMAMNTSSSILEIERAFASLFVSEKSVGYRVSK